MKTTPAFLFAISFAVTVVLRVCAEIPGDLAPIPVAVGSSPAGSLDVPLQQEILAMAAEDQRVRKNPVSTISPEQREERLRVDQKNGKRIKEIVAQYGWPGRSLIGAAAAHKAWLLVQHSDFEFMQRCLPRLEQAVAAGEAEARDHAYLLDRVLWHQDKPQVYGTQGSSMTGKMRLHPIADPEHVDERRRAVGLGPLAEYAKRLGVEDSVAADSRFNASLELELLALGAEERELQLKLTAGQVGLAERNDSMKLLRRQQGDRIKAIVVEHGWPGASLVGTRGAFTAWLLVQNSGDASLVAHCLPLLEKAVTDGEAEAKNYAYLLDLFRMNQGVPQVYGTQFTPGPDGKIVSYAIGDPKGVDARRRAVGLEPLAVAVERVQQSSK